MKQTILSRSADELKIIEDAVACGKIGFGTMGMISHRMWILRRLVKVYRLKGHSAPFEVFSMLGEFELIRQKFIRALMEDLSKAGGQLPK